MWSIPIRPNAPCGRPQRIWKYGMQMPEPDINRPLSKMVLQRVSSCSQKRI